MNTGFYDALTFDFLQGRYVWVGTATLATIIKCGLTVGRFVGYDDARLTVNEWACRAS